MRTESTASQNVAVVQPRHVVDRGLKGSGRSLSRLQVGCMTERVFDAGTCGRSFETHLPSRPCSVDLIPSIRPLWTLSRCGSQNQPGLLTRVDSFVLHVGSKLTPRLQNRGPNPNRIRNLSLFFLSMYTQMARELLREASTPRSGYGARNRS